MLPETDARPQGYVPRRAATGHRGRALPPGPASAHGAAAAQAFADPYPGRHGYAQPETYEEPGDYGDSGAYSEPRGYQAARGRLYAVPSEAGSGYQAESPRTAQPARDPRYDAASIRQAAEQDAAAIREQAAEEAAALTRQAAEEAAKIREAAEKQAAELRAALQTMQGELGRVATYVTENLTVPAIPAVRPAEAPVTRPTVPATRPASPASRPATQPSRPVTRPTGPVTRPARPAVSPDERPHRKSGKRPRQYNAMLVSRFAVAAGILAALGAGTAELAMHGPSFFVFRQGGAGETPGFNTKDQQFLSQHQPKPAAKPATPKTVRPGAHSASKPAAKAGN